MKDLEFKIAALEKENAEKEVEIKRLLAAREEASAAAPAAAVPAAAKTVEQPAASNAAGKTAAPPSLEEPKAKKGPWEGFTRIQIPKPRNTTQQEKDSLTVYEDDPALGKTAPLMTRLKWFNGEAVEFGQGKPVVITFFSKLNKGDFGTLSLMSEYSLLFKDEVLFAGVSRDGEEEDVSKFAGKYHGKYFDELQTPDGKPGLAVYSTFPLGFDQGDGFNQQLKQVMRKGTVGVGMTVLVDAQGVIRWYEQFVRGINPMGQLQQQIQNLIDGKPLVTNGPAPETQVIEESAGDIPDDVDPFAKTGKY